MDPSALPEGCISHILSLTTPIDAIRSSLVSKRFLSAVNSDVVWDKFLPSDYAEIMSQSLIPIKFGSKKELFFLLCRSHVLIDDGTKSFALDKCTGKKCYMLGARTLSITWGESPQYWTWEPMPQSRFPEVAKLQRVCWLDIKGKIHTKLLSPNTTYGAYFVFKMVHGNFREFDRTPVTVLASKYDEDGLPMDHFHNIVHRSFYLTIPESEEDNENRRGSGAGVPVGRDDGWMEIEMGRYVNGAEGREVLEMTVKETDILEWKDGLVVHGIEFRPLD